MDVAEEDDDITVDVALREDAAEEADGVVNWRALGRDDVGPELDLHPGWHGRRLRRLRETRVKRHT